MGHTQLLTTACESPGEVERKCLHTARERAIAVGPEFWQREHERCPTR